MNDAEVEFDRVSDIAVAAAKRITPCDLKQLARGRTTLNVKALRSAVAEAETLVETAKAEVQQGRPAHPVPKQPVTVLTKVVQALRRFLS